MQIYADLLRPMAFRSDAERMHDLAVRVGEIASHVPLFCSALAGHIRRSYPRLECNVAGLTFDNPLGLAAGYDKNGRATPLWAAFGFGHIEIGSVSADPSPGNPRPRLWRIPADRGLIVNYGLPNDGAERVAVRLAGVRTPVPLGINLVNTNRGTQAAPATDDDVVSDYVRSIRLLEPHASYLVLNLSCPNTADGRSFVSDTCRTRRLFEAVREAAPSKPVFLKVAPFPDACALDSFLELADGFSFVRGFSINLPPGKPVSLKLPANQVGRMPGAVSGTPCTELMDRAAAELFRRIDSKRCCLIGSGGVFDAAGAYRKIRLGASLIQLLTSLVYEGPGIVRRILEDLDQLLANDGFSRVSQAVGIDVQPLKTAR